jgi:biopolymer transport protein ExbD
MRRHASRFLPAARGDIVYHRFVGTLPGEVRERSKAMGIGTTTANDGPVSDINTTPLIDVMLVLPIQTHAVKIDTPPAGPTPRNDVHPVRNDVSVDHAGTIFWNGKGVSQTVLRQYLDQSQRMNPIPELHVRPNADARYETVDQVLAIAKRAHVARMGFVDNDAYAGL